MAEINHFLSDDEAFRLDIVSVRLVKNRESLASDEPLTSPEAVVRALAREMSEYDREVIGVINFDIKMRPINVNFVSAGALNISIAHPREILKSAILSNAYAMMMIHNHPSQDVTPSRNDAEITDRMMQLCELVEIPLLDHIIVGGNGEEYFSFADKEVMPVIRPHYETDYMKLNFMHVAEDTESFTFTDSVNSLSEALDETNNMLTQLSEKSGNNVSEKLSENKKYTDVKEAIENRERYMSEYESVTDSVTKVGGYMNITEEQKNIYRDIAEKCESFELFSLAVGKNEQWSDEEGAEKMLKEIYNSAHGNKPQRLFVDMDGTLAVFRVVDTLETLYEPGYFLNLEPNENVVGAVKQLINNPETDVYVLSSYLSDSSYALAEKNKWLDKYLPELPKEKRLFVPCGIEKSTVVPEGIREDDFLLDDYTKNLNEWEPPAKGIKLLNAINHTHGTWKSDRIRFNRPPEEISRKITEIMKGESHYYEQRISREYSETDFVMNDKDAEPEEHLENKGISK